MSDKRNCHYYHPARKGSQYTTNIRWPCRYLRNHNYLLRYLRHSISYLALAHIINKHVFKLPSYFLLPFKFLQLLMKPWLLKLYNAAHVSLVCLSNGVQSSTCFGMLSQCFQLISRSIIYLTYSWVIIRTLSLFCTPSISYYHTRYHHNLATTGFELCRWARAKDRTGEAE